MTHEQRLAQQAEKEAEEARLDQLAVDIYEKCCICTERFYYVMPHLQNVQQRVYGFVCAQPVEECAPCRDARGFVRTRKGGSNVGHAFDYFKPRTQSTIHGRYKPLVLMGAIEILGYWPSHDPRVVKPVTWYGPTLSGLILPEDKMICDALYVKRLGITIGFKHGKADKKDIMSAIDWLESRGVAQEDIIFNPRVTLPDLDMRERLRKLKEDGIDLDVDDLDEDE